MTAPELIFVATWANGILALLNATAFIRSRQRYNAVIACANVAALALLVVT